MAREVGERAGCLWSCWFGHKTGRFWAVTTGRHPWDGHVEARDALTLLAKINEVDAFYGGPRRRPHGSWGRPEMDYADEHPEIFDVDLEPPGVYTVDAASGEDCMGRGYTCGKVAVMLLELERSGTRCPYCLACWRSVADILNQRGHTLNYTPAAIAAWERPGAV